MCLFAQFGVLWIKYRLDQCGALTELLKRFQSVRGELGGSLQRAESTINEQVSYMGKDNLQRLHAKVEHSVFVGVWVVGQFASSVLKKDAKILCV